MGEGRRNVDRASYIDCVMHEIEQDKELYMFFQNLYRKMHEVREESGKEQSKSAWELAMLAEKYAAERLKLEEKLRESGIVLGGEKAMPTVDMKMFRSRTCDSSLISSMFSSRHPTIPLTRYSRSTTFNGFEFDQQKLSRLLPEAIYEAKDSYDSCKKAKEDAEAELANLEHKIFISPSRRKERETHLKKVISTQEREIQKLEQEIAVLEFILSLKLDQKQDLMKYFLATDGIKEAAMLIKRLEEPFRLALPDIKSPEVVKRAMKLMVEDGMTKEELDHIFEKLGEISTRRARGEYKVSSKAFYGDKIVVGSFIDHIYGNPDVGEKKLDDFQDRKDTSDYDDNSDIGE